MKRGIELSWLIYPQEYICTTVETVVTTINITDVSASIFKAQSKENVPDVTQLNSVIVFFNSRYTAT